MKRNLVCYDILDLEQGSDEWKQHRFEYVTASQFPVLASLCPYQKRDDLLNEKLTRTEREATSFQKVLYERGHKAEAAGRTWVEENLQITVPPAVVVSRKSPDLLASLDGFNPENKIIFEAKYMGSKSIEALKSGIIKPNHKCQVQAQLFATGAEKCIYFAMDEHGNAAMADIYPDEFYFKFIPVLVNKFMTDLKRLKGELQ